MKIVPLHGFGNSGLIPNFEVSVFASEEALPEKCGDNTIGVISNVPMKGWTFSDSEPETKIEGHVWIRTGAGSVMGFNALKHNAMWVYPVAGYQYEGDAFVKKDIQIWQNGAWRGKVLYLYQNGDDCEAVTGGWIAVAKSSAGPAKAPVIATTDSGMKVTLSATANGQKGCAQPKNVIDVTRFNKIYFRVTALSEAGSVSLGVTSDIEKSAFSFAALSTATKGDVEVDISAVEGPCCVIIQCGNGDGVNTISVTIDQVHLE